MIRVLIITEREHRWLDIQIYLIIERKHQTSNALFQEWGHSREDINQSLPLLCRSQTDRQTILFNI